LANAEAQRIDAQFQRLQPFEQLVDEQRQLLGPRRRRHVNGEHAPCQCARLGATRHAIAQQPTPGIAVDRHFAVLGRNHAGAVQQLSQHLRA
jgi:hypothetical protein